MNNLLFISSLDISNNRTEFDGVTKKLLLEIRTFKQLGYRVDYIERNDGTAYIHRFDGTRDMIIKLCGVFYKDQSNIYKTLLTTIPQKQYSHIYIRYEGCHIAMSRFLYHISGSEVKVVAELPTYMGKWEPGTSLQGKLRFLLKRLIDKFMPMPFDYFITFDNHDRLFGKKTIKIENFTDVEKTPVRQTPTSKNELHLIGVAMMTPSHGFDRVIKGMSSYFKNNPSTKVYFHVVGGGMVADDWRKLSVQLGIDKYVIFEGIKSGQELDELFNNCHMGVATLAIFRKKCKKASELKIREYCARGIPFIYSADEPILKDKGFALKVPHDETEIDIYNIVQFIQNIDMSGISEQMHAFALKECSCISQLQKVFNYEKPEKKNQRYKVGN